MVHLSNRMQAIADMVPKGCKTADIGCDHGFVSIYLVEQGIAPYVYACDVRKGPLQRAQEHIFEAGLSDKIETRLSDGAQALEVKEAECAIIAGMGGMLMLQLLKDSEEKFKCMEALVLSPHSDIEAVRHYLGENSYTIVDENMVFDEGKYYTVIKATYSEGKKVKYSKIEECFGPELIKSKSAVLKDYLHTEINKAENVIKSLDNMAEDVNEDKKNAYEIRIQQLKGSIRLMNETLSKM